MTHNLNTKNFFEIALIWTCVKIILCLGLLNQLLYYVIFIYFLRKIIMLSNTHSLRSWVFQIHLKISPFFFIVFTCIGLFFYYFARAFYSSLIQSESIDESLMRIFVEWRNPGIYSSINGQRYKKSIKFITHEPNSIRFLFLLYIYNLYLSRTEVVFKNTCQSRQFVD